tara:strand:+ start:52 stop:1131 length:1080 start_codon:yes stop_codon:yes gene_type:complete
MTSSQKYDLSLSVYRDIINGYSAYVDGSDEIYIKHLKDADQSFFQHKKEYFRSIALEKGLLTQEAYIEVLKDTGHWSSAEEEEYQHLIKEIHNLEETRSEVFLESQRKTIEARIKSKREKLQKSAKARSELRVNTVEDFCEHRVNDFIMSFCLYKDRELKHPFFSEEAYSELHLEEIEHYSNIYIKVLEKLNQKNIKRVGHSAIFLNNYLLAKAIPYHFFGKRILDLTIYQNTICSYGNSCKNILEYAETSMGNLEDIDEVIEWYARERKAIDRKYNSDNSKGGSFGGSSPSAVKADGLPSKQERFEAIGVMDHNQEEFEQAAREKDALPIDYKKAAEKLKKDLKKDTLDTRDLVKLHE